MTIAGVVLAGGQSSRYGKPKMFEYHKGKQFYEHSIDALKANALSPIIVATNEKLLPYFQRKDVQYICESKTNAHQGPLYAIANVLKNTPDAEWVFVLSCDIPYVTSDFVAKMIIYTNDNMLDAIVPVHSGRKQPLLSLYHRRCLPEMERLLLDNQRKIGLLFNNVNTLMVPFSDDDHVFTNINYQKDWYERQ